MVDHKDLHYLRQGMMHGWIIYEDILIIDLILEELIWKVMILKVYTCKA